MCYVQTMSWAEKIRGAITQVKDTGASAAIERWLSKELADYGELLDFKLNSRDKTIEVHVLLKGENEKLTVHIDEYELVSAGEDDYVIIRRAKASREWVDTVLRKFLIDKRHRIPRQYSSMVKLVLKG
jgi:hypothetical protein